MGLGMSTALRRTLGSKLDRVLPYRDALVEGKRGQIRLYSPNLWQDSPQKERGAAGNRAQPGFRLPPRAMSYLQPPVNVYKAGLASSVQRPDPSPALPRILLPAGQGRATGTIAGRKNPAPRCLCNTIGPALPP